MLKALKLPNLSNKSNLKWPGGGQKQKTVCRDDNGQNISGKFCFSCEIAEYGKSSISLLQQFYASIDKDLALGYKSIKYWEFPNIF